MSIFKEADRHYEILRARAEFAQAGVKGPKDFFSVPTNQVMEFGHDPTAFTTKAEPRKQSSHMRQARKLTGLSTAKLTQADKALLAERERSSQVQLHPADDVIRPVRPTFKDRVRGLSNRFKNLGLPEVDRVKRLKPLIPVAVAALGLAGMSRISGGVQVARADAQASPTYQLATPQGQTQVPARATETYVPTAVSTSTSVETSTPLSTVTSTSTETALAVPTAKPTEEEVSPDRKYGDFFSEWAGACEGKFERTRDPVLQEIYLQAEINGITLRKNISIGLPKGLDIKGAKIWAKWNPRESVGVGEHKGRGFVHAIVQSSAVSRGRVEVVYDPASGKAWLYKYENGGWAWTEHDYSWTIEEMEIVNGRPAQLGVEYDSRGGEGYFQQVTARACVNSTPTETSTAVNTSTPTSTAESTPTPTKQTSTSTATAPTPTATDSIPTVTSTSTAESTPTPTKQTSTSTAAAPTPTRHNTTTSTSTRTSTPEGPSPTPTFVDLPTPTYTPTATSVSTSTATPTIDSPTPRTPGNTPVSTNTPKTPSTPNTPKTPDTPKKRGTPRLPGMPHTGGGGSAHEHAVWSSATTNETRKPVKAHLRRDEQVWQWRDTMGQIQMIVLSANKPNLPLEEISSSY